MFGRKSICALAAFLATMTGAAAFDNAMFPDWKGEWSRIGSWVWDPTKPGGAGQQAPLTAEYQAIFEANLAKGKAGVQFDIKGTCGPVGMPRLMIFYEPMETIIKPDMIHMLFESMSPIRRVYTDGRGWPEQEGFFL